MSLMMHPLASSCVLVSLLAGCVGSPMAEPDAGGTPDAGALALPASPIFGCPDGWREATLDGVQLCEPWAEERAPVCGALELTLPGQPLGEACQPVWPCPSGEWPDDVPASAIYVRPGATGGDGSAARPYGDLFEGAGAAFRRNAALVLGEGEFLGNIGLTNIPAVIGLCPERTRVVNPAALGVGLAAMDGPVEFRGLLLRSGIGLEIADGASATLSGVVIEGTSTGLKLGVGASVDGDRVRIRGATVLDTNVHQPAIHLADDSQVTLRHATLTGVGGAIITPQRTAVLAPDYIGTVTLEDSSILDTAYGIGGPTSATLTRVAIERTSLGVSIAHGDLHLTDVRLRDIGETPWEDNSAGIVMAGGALVLERVAVTDVHGFALAALARPGIPCSVSGQDLIITRTHGSSSPARTDHTAVLANGADASVTLERVYLASVSGTAFHGEDGARVVLRDVHVDDTTSIGTYGRAFEMRGVSFELQRAFARSADLGLFVVNDTDARVSDLTLEESLGIQVQCGHTDACTREATILTLERARLTNLHRVGVVSTNATVHVSDLTVDGVLPLVPDVAPDEFPGVGLLVVVEGTLDGERVVIRNVSGVGVLGYDRANIHLASLEIADMSAVACSACESPSYGDGVLWTLGGSMTLEDFSVARSERAGIVAGEAFGPPLFLRGSVHDNGFGVLTRRAVERPADFAGLTLDANGQDFAVVDFSLAFDPSTIEY